MGCKYGGRSDQASDGDRNGKPSAFQCVEASRQTMAGAIGDFHWPLPEKRKFTPIECTALESFGGALKRVRRF